MKKLIYGTMAALALTGLTASAQTRIATVDLKQLFEKYYKTKEADSALKERAADFDKEYKGLREDLKKAGEDYQKLLTETNDQAVSVEERAKRKKAAEDKLKSIRESEDTTVQFERNARATLDEQRRRMRDKVLDIIRTAITGRAKAAGYSLVVDTAAETINNTPVVLFSAGDNDLTEAVLTQLNATAPVETAKPPEKKDDKKDEKKKEEKK